MWTFFFFSHKCGASDPSHHLCWIPAVPVVAVQSRQFLHVRIADGEVENHGVQPDSVWIRRLGEHGDALLHGPAQQHLTGRKRSKGQREEEEEVLK